MSESLSIGALIAECEERERAAQVELDDCCRYAAWQRSPEGQAHRDEWIGGGPEGGDKDIAFYEAEVTFFASLRAQLITLRDHRCGLPPSIVDALNSGDGTYRP